MDSFMEENATAVDDDCDSNSSQSSVPFENVKKEYLDSDCEDQDEDNSPSNIDEFPTGDQFPLELERGGAPPVRGRMPQQRDPGQYESFRHRPKKKEMRRGSFSYKQVSDDATPTAHRKMLFSKRSACKLTEVAEEETMNGKHAKVNDYYFLKTLGKGAYGEVRLATKDLVEDDFSQHTKRFAIKVMKRSMFEERKQLPFRGRRHTDTDISPVDDVQRSTSGPLQDSSIPSALLQEINIMKRLAHPNLVKLVEIINDEHSKFLFLVLEHMQGGTVMIHDKNTNTYVYGLTKRVMLEATARRLFKELASALSYLHANHIAHRDIKPDNLLIDFDGKLKLSDFGVSTHFQSDRNKNSVSMRSLARSTSRGQMQQTEGTFAFYSPEMCRTEHGVDAKAKGHHHGYNAYMADLWASAVCLWIFVFGTVPFESHDVTELFRLIRDVQPSRPHRLSPELDNLLGLMLRKDVKRRPSVMDVRHHCWVTETPLAQHAEVQLTDTDVVTEERNALKAVTSASALSTAISVTRANSKESGPKNIVSPALQVKLRAWMGRARKTCFSRHQAFVVGGQAETNALVRKAAAAELKQIANAKKSGDIDSDASSDFSMGSADSNSEDNLSVVSVTDLVSRNGNEFKNVFGTSFDDDEDGGDSARSPKRHSAPPSPALSKSLSSRSGSDRSIFQRGIHKIEKRIQERITDSPKSGGDNFSDDEESPKRMSLVRRGIHKVAKKLSLSGPNTDKHLYEEEANKDSKSNATSEPSATSEEVQAGSRHPENGGKIDEKTEKLRAASMLGWFSRNKSV